MNRVERVLLIKYGILFSLAWVGVSCEASPPSLARSSDCQSFDEVQIEWDQLSSAPAMITGGDLRAVRQRCEGSSDDEDGTPQSPPEIASAILKQLSPLYGYREDLQLIGVDTDLFGGRHVRFDQIASSEEGEAQVIGARVTVHLNSVGAVHKVSGRYWPQVDHRGALTLNPAQAEELARAHVRSIGYAQPVIESTRVILNPRRSGVERGYEVILSSGMTQRGRYFVSEGSGAVQLIESLVYTLGPEGPGRPETLSGVRLLSEGGEQVSFEGWYSEMDELYYLYNQTRSWSAWTANAECSELTQCFAQPQTSWGSEEPTAISLAYNLDASLKYFWDVHGYQGWDGQGGHTVAIAHYACHQPNAFYLGGGVLAFGDGGEGINELTALDVVAHELTHALTQTTAGLLYQGESGAINESFSDIFAVLIEFATQPESASPQLEGVPGRADWMIGEDVTSSALRDLSAPRRDDLSFQGPSWYRGDGWVEITAENESRALHSNSSVQNFFFYLLAQGGDGVNEGEPYTLTGVGLEDAGALAFHTLTVYAHPSSDYQDIRRAWLAAAQDFDREVGEGTRFARAVDEAWAAVGVAEAPCVVSYLDADLDGFGDPERPSSECAPPAGYVLNQADCDDAQSAVYPEALEVCGDGQINDCLVRTAERPCGEVMIERVMSGLRVSWPSDCQLETSSDGEAWSPHAGALSAESCVNWVEIDPSEDQLFFRLSLD